MVRLMVGSLFTLPFSNGGCVLITLLYLSLERVPEGQKSTTKSCIFFQWSIIFVTVTVIIYLVK